MTEIQRYLAEEIAEDHAHGFVSRREAVRRLGLLGLSGAAAASCTALRKAGLKYSTVTYLGVDHAFFNPTSSRYDRAAATAAYRRMISWFDR